MLQLEFKNDVNPIAVFMNTIPLLGSIAGFLEGFQTRLLYGQWLMFTILTYVLLANFIRLVRPKIMIELHKRKLVYRSMFGWKRSIPIDVFFQDFLVVIAENRDFLYEPKNDFITLYKDGIRSLFNLKRRSNLYYKDQLIYKGIR